MGEIKSVKVDNWGVFFLQKLQNFFNKTDYCDLTLQFRDNSQLKVHRLVLSACTDYFNVLEQTCEVVDDAIIMPNGLQADVVVPIVNFMYTGTLEFELKMYNRLLRTAKDMNMTVLLKLLEAHRRTMEMHPQKNQAPTSPKAKRKMVPTNATGTGISSNLGGRSLIQPQNKRIVVSGTTAQQQRITPANVYTRIATGPTSGAIPTKQQIGSTTFTRIKQESDQESNVVSGGGGGGYTLLKRTPQQSTTPASPFEQLRKGYTNNNKRPPTATFVSPPAKKPNLEDVKEFAEQQRMRKQIAAEFGDDGDYDTGIMDDDTIHNDDDDEDTATAAVPTSQQQHQQQQQEQQGTSTSSSAAVQTSLPQQSEDPPGTTTIIVKHEGPDKPPTIVVKDSSNSKMNHAKIISEVLRQYPHLVNSNKNIKLKIMPNAGGHTQKVIVKKEVAETDNVVATVAAPVAASKLPTLPPKLENKGPSTSPAVLSKPKQQTGLLVASNTNKHTEESSNKVSTSTTSSSNAAAGPAQKRRIDSKTMHALIALGAENTTGPWLCLRCGRNGHPISIPSYRGFRRHLINTHKESIDPALCEHCGWRSASKRELHFHMQLEHKVRTNLYIFPECQLCQHMCIDSDALNQHLIDSHPDENKQQCIYCNKIFPEELQLYTHMKTFHKKQALEDGIIDYSDDENANIDPVFPPPEDEEMLLEELEAQQQQQPEKKIKILSDISLPIASSIIKTDTFVTENVTAGESTTSVASEEYLQEQEHVETKFVAADGSEVILTDEQRKEILSQLNQENEGSGVVMVLNENQQFAGGETQSEQGAISHDETSQATTATNEEQDDHDDSHIYNELKSQTSEAIEEDSESQPTVADTIDHHEDDPEEVVPTQEEKMHHEHLDESKESIDNLEWAENLISEHEMAEHVSPAASEFVSNDQPKKEEEQSKNVEKAQDDISNKLKELAGEWSEDDEADEDMPDEIVAPKPEEGMENIENVLKPTEDDTTGAVEAENVVDEIAEAPEDNNGTEKEKREDVTTPAQEFKHEEKESTEEADKPQTEDDVDLALESLHKEDNDEKQENPDETHKNSTESKENEKDMQNVSESEKEVDNKEIEVEDTEPNNDQNKSKEAVEDTKAVSEHDESKNELIDMLKSEDTEIVNKDISHDKNVDVSSTDAKEEKVTEGETENVENSKKEEPAIDDEFLDITPEKVKESGKEEPAAASSSTEKETDTATITSSKDTNPISSEERVKSLISEWGDDDDEDENGADLTPNL